MRRGLSCPREDTLAHIDSPREVVVSPDEEVVVSQNKLTWTSQEYEQKYEQLQQQEETKKLKQEKLLADQRKKEDAALQNRLEQERELFKKERVAKLALEKKKFQEKLAAKERQIGAKKVGRGIGGRSRLIFMEGEIERVGEERMKL